MKNRELHIKSVYFLAFFGISAWITWFNIYLKESLGLSGKEIGVLGGLLPAAMIFIVPVWGFIADKFGKIKVISVVLVLTSLFLLLYIPGMTFGYILSITLILSMVYTSFGSLLDSIALEHIEDTGKSHYGALRMWASVGWGASSLVVGTILARTSNYALIFPIASALLFCSLLILRFSYKNNSKKQVNQSLSIVHSIKLLSNPDLIFFLLVLFVYGLASSPVFQFLNLYYEEIGFSGQEIGYAFAIQSFSELPLFFYARNIITRYGPKRVLIFSMVITAMRFGIYYFFPNPAIAIGFSVTHGVSISLFLVSAITYMQRYIPSDMLASGQALLWATYLGAGATAGNILSGYFKDLFGMRTALGIYCAVILIVSVITSAAFKRIIKKGKPFRIDFKPILDSWVR